MTRPIILRGILLMSIALFLPAAAQAQPFVDDFEDGSIADGSPVSWVPYVALESRDDSRHPGRSASHTINRHNVIPGDSQPH